MRGILRHTLLFAVAFSLTILIGCVGGNNAGEGGGDDDEGVIPTTLDLTLVPVQQNDNWVLGEGPGEPHQIRNDLNTYPTRTAEGKKPLSMTYFMVFADTHQTDEESPTRLTFFDSFRLLGGLFGAAFRPQEDLEAQLLNAIVRTANRIQTDYDRDFDFAISLGDNTDNGQLNEMQQLIDVMDGEGEFSGITGYARVDSGDLDIDPKTHLDRGERNFGIQETDAEGNNIDAFNRPGYPNSNADIPTSGLVNSKGKHVPWFTAVGNHDVLNTGNFNPYSGPTFFSAIDYTGNIAYYGFIPGFARTILFWKENPGTPIFIANGFFGMDLDWSLVLGALDAIGMIPDDYTDDIDWRFDLSVLQHDTPTVPTDDGVEIAPDPNREFMSLSGLSLVVNEAGHGFADNNNDGVINGLDGGYYQTDWEQIEPDSHMPLRILVLNTTDQPLLAEGGIGPDELAWLQAELNKAVEDKVLVIIASHHMESATIQGHNELQQLLNSCPNVILHLVGHGHYNMIVAHPSPDSDPLKGYWEVETTSNAEFPQQARIAEIVDNRDGTGSIYLTLFDHWPTKNDGSDTLATLGRELAFYDSIKGQKYDGSEALGGVGTADDRNRVLKFQIPTSWL